MVHIFHWMEHFKDYAKKNGTMDNLKENLNFLFKKKEVVEGKNTLQ